MDDFWTPQLRIDLSIFLRNKKGNTQKLKLPIGKIQTIKVLIFAQLRIMNSVCVTTSEKLMIAADWMPYLSF